MTTQRKSSTIASSMRRTLSTCSEETESVCVALSWRIAAISRTPWIRLTIDVPTLSRRMSSLTTLASARGNSIAARSVSMSMLSMESISTISTPRHSSRSASGCPCVCCRQYAQVSAKRSHDCWLEIPRLAIHFLGSNSPALFICALLTATIVLSLRGMACRSRQAVPIVFHVALQPEIQWV